MNKKFFQNSGFFLLALIFSVGLMFAFTELPKLLDQLLQATIGTPHNDPAYDAYKIELFYDAYGIRWIGYACLMIILLLIILGFTTKKTSLAWTGGVVLFLPVFATFANSMFYLAGLGLLNIVFFPLQDISLSLIDLGKVVLIPYWILMWFFGLFNWYAHNFLMYAFMAIGAFIFVLGVFAWIRTRYDKNKVARHWIYKYSRHPQYLGWIIWSYGLMLFGPSLNNMKKSWGWYGTLPWLLSALIIIGICFLEEIKMSEQAEDYEEYRNRTPFLFPIPLFLKQLLKFPMRLIIRKNHPEKRKEVGLTIAVYAIILMGCSLLWVDLKPEGSQNIAVAESYQQAKVDSLLIEITKEQPRRYRSTKPYRELLLMGPETYRAFFELMEHPDLDVRDFAVQAAYKYNVEGSIPYLIRALKDPEFRVIQTAVRGLGELKAKEAEDTLIYFIENPREGVSLDLLLEALSKIGSHKIMPTLEKRIQDSVWYHTTAALRSMTRIDFNTAKKYLYESLEDERPLVRREAVYMLLDSLPVDAVPHLEKVLNDEHWEIRFYARQAIKKINEKNNCMNNIINSP